MMDLKYIWIKEFQSLKNIGLNFNHKNRDAFKFNGRELEVIENPPPILNFGQNISGVTAIAGQNGTGKTSILEAILSLIATVDNGPFGYNEIVPAIVCIDNAIYYQNGIVIENFKELQARNYSVQSYNESPFEEYDVFHEGARFTKYLFFSNQLDYRSFRNDVGLINLTIENLHTYYVHSSYRRFRDTNEVQMPTDKSRDLISKHDAALLQLHRWWLRYLLQSSFHPLDLNPSSISIRVTYSGNNTQLTPDNNEALKVAVQIEKGILNQADGLKILEASLLKTTILKLQSLNVLRQIIDQHNIDLNRNEIVEFVYESKVPDAIERLDKGSKLREYHELFSVLLNSSEIEDVDFAKVDYLPERMAYEGNKFFFALPPISLRWSDKVKAELGRLFQLEDDLFNAAKENRVLNDYLLFPLPNGGKLSCLSFFSQMFCRLKDQDEDTKYCLLLDEMELAFHPVWKKKLLSWILEFLQMDFPDKQFQIILTTHSPFVLSDLPRTNSILLEFDDAGLPRICQDDTIKTFGNNIHELLATSFFMNEGTIGNFAIQILESLIEFLKSENATTKEWSRENAEKVIEEVGDELVKAKLRELFDKKYDTGLSLDEEEADLRSRLLKIERIKLRRND